MLLSGMSVVVVACAGGPRPTAGTPAEIPTLKAPAVQQPSNAQVRFRLASALMAATRKIPSHMTSELNALVAQKKTVLEIRDFISGEFEPVPLADVMEYFEAQAKAGAVKLTERPEETKKPGAKAPVRKTEAKT